MLSFFFETEQPTVNFIRILIVTNNHFINQKIPNAMKHKFLVMAMCLSAALAFNGCSSDKEEDPVPEEQNENKEDNEENNQGNNEDNNQDNNGENNQNNNDDETDDGKNPELVEFYSKFPMAGKSGYADYSVANDYDRIKNLIPTGNYIFTLYYDTKQAKQYVLSKGSDGSLMIFDVDDLESKSSYIGSSLYVESYGDDGKNSMYWIYPDQFGSGNDYKPAPTYAKFEYLSREELIAANAMLSDITNSHEKCLATMFSTLEKTFAPTFTNAYTDKKFMLNSEKTDLYGVPCTHYYITLKPGEEITLFGQPVEDIPEILQEWWLTDDFITLQLFDWGIAFGWSKWKLDGFIKGGTMAENYAALTEAYSPFGKCNWDDCLENHKKTANEWLSDEYPESLNNILIRYQHDISSFEISRRAWLGCDNIVGITIHAKDATPEQAREYIAEVRKLGFDILEDSDAETEKLIAAYDLLSDEDKEKYFNNKRPEMSDTVIEFTCNNENAVDPGIGQTLIYYEYRIIYNGFMGINAGLTIEFIPARLTGV